MQATLKEVRLPPVKRLCPLNVLWHARHATNTSSRGGFGLLVGGAMAGSGWNQKSGRNREVRGRGKLWCDVMRMTSMMGKW